MGSSQSAVTDAGRDSANPSETSSAPALAVQLETPHLQIGSSAQLTSGDINQAQSTGDVQSHPTQTAAASAEIPSTLRGTIDQQLGPTKRAAKESSDCSNLRVG